VLGGLLSEPSNVESASRASQDDSELAPIVLHTNTPDTSLSQGKDQAALKRVKEEACCEIVAWSAAGHRIGGSGRAKRRGSIHFYEEC
jgi:hypothetical protein